MNQSKRFLHRKSTRSLVLLGWLSLGACATEEVPLAADGPVSCAFDGDASTVIANATGNTRAHLVRDAIAGTKTIFVDKAELAKMELKHGDLLMIMQMPSAPIDTNNNSLRGSAFYEGLRVAEVLLQSGAVTVDDGCGTLRNTYLAGEGSQIIRLPSPTRAGNAAVPKTIVGPQADLQVRLTAAPSPSRSGQPITYIVSVRNAGSDSASNVVLTFEIPARSTVVSDPLGDNQESGFTCTVSANLLTCTRQTLARDAAPEVYIAVRPELGVTPVQGRASVTSDLTDPDLSNNSASAKVDVTYDPMGFYQPVLSGGGFGCSLAQSGLNTGHGANPGLFMLGALYGTAALLFRRRAPRPS